ncbi:MAG: PAS domain S-box protein, partial [Candidatus Hadarchaeota archaeon]
MANEKREKQKQVLTAAAAAENILSSMVDTLILLGRNGKILQVNRAALDLLGYKENDLIGQPVSKILPGARAGATLYTVFEETGLRELIKKGYVRDVEIVYRARDGRKIPLSFSGSEVKDDKGELLGIVCVAKDLSEIKRAKEEREKALAEKASLIDVMSDNIIVCDLKGNIAMTNTAIQKHLAGRNINTKNLIGKPIAEVMPFVRKEDAKKHAKLIKEIIEEGSAAPIEVFGRGDRWYNIAAFLLKDEKSNPSGFFTVSRDITKLKQAEEVLREQYNRLKEIDEMKSRFVSIATHELRTPLASIKGYTSMVRKGYGGKLSKDADEMLEVAERNVDRLSDLTNDLLDEQRLESGRFQISPDKLKLQEIVEAAVQEITPLIDSKNQILDVRVQPGLPPLNLDKNRMIQVILNLLSNACKFTPQGGSISLQARDNGEMVEVQVSDTGLGIAAEDIDKLFKPFPDIQKSIEYQSTGLGLSICKGIVNLHGGKIWAESKGIGKGTTFTFTMPKHEGT